MEFLVVNLASNLERPSRSITFVNIGHGKDSNMLSTNSMTSIDVCECIRNSATKSRYEKYESVSGLHEGGCFDRLKSLREFSLLSIFLKNQLETVF